MNEIPRFVWSKRAGMVLAATWWLSFAVVGAAVESDPVIELPKFVVSDYRILPEPESWRYARLPGVEAISNASDRETQKILGEFQLYREVLDSIWPVPSDLNTPLLVVLCGRPGKFETFVPDGADRRTGAGRASLYLHGRWRGAILVDVSVHDVRVEGNWENDVSKTSSVITIDPVQQIFREYVHFRLRQSRPRLPAWFEEGMAQVAMAIRIEDDVIELGKLQDSPLVSIFNTPKQGSGTSSFAADNSIFVGMGEKEADIFAFTNPLKEPVEDGAFVEMFKRRAMIPFGDFIAIGANSPEAQNAIGSAWAKQAYAFVHLGLFGERGRWQKPLAEYLVRSSREPATEALFKSCFGVSYREMGSVLRGYVSYSDYVSHRYHEKTGKRMSPPVVVLRDATPSEVGRIKGQVQLLAGHRDLARAEFIAPYIRGDRDPELLASLGLIERDLGRDDRARKFLSVAAAEHSRDPDAYVQLARLKFVEAYRANQTTPHPLSRQQTIEILALLKPALSLPPPQSEALALYAATLAAGAKAVVKDDLAPLVAGVRRYPTDFELVYDTAVLCAGAGVTEAAHSLTDHGLASVTDAGMRTKFERLKAALPPDLAPQTQGATAKPSRPNG